MTTYEIIFIVGFTLHKKFIDAKTEAEAITEFWRRMVGVNAELVKAIEHECDYEKSV